MMPPPPTRPFASVSLNLAQKRKLVIVEAFFSLMGSEKEKGMMGDGGWMRFVMRFGLVS